MATSAERQETAPQDDDTATQVIALPDDDDVTRGGLFPEEDAVTYGGVLSQEAAAARDGAVLNDAATRGVPFEDEADTAKGKVTPGDELTLDVGLLVGNDPTLDVGFPVSNELAQDDLLPMADPGPPGVGGDSGVRRNVRLPERAKREGWRYVAEGKRDLRLDLLRGFAVFAMVVDHIGGSSWLYALTGGNRFFVSAAEAFVFISGLTVGIVYGDRLRRDRLRSVTVRLLARAWTLYAMAVWLAIGTAFFAAIFGLPRGVILTANPARFIIEVITLQRTYYLVDVMLLYAFLLALAPLALAALRMGGWWYVLLISCALWSAHQSIPTELALPWHPDLVAELGGRATA